MRQTFAVRVLWRQEGKDRCFSRGHVRAWYAAIEHAGGTARLVMQPYSGNDERNLFAPMRGTPIRSKAFDNVLVETGFAR